MAYLDETFDASAIDPSQSFEVVPAGKYHVQIVRDEMRNNKDDKPGSHLWLEMAIMDGPYANYRVIDRLNLVNPSQQTVEIAQRKLSAICHAVGQLSVKNTEQLHHRSLIATVYVSPEVKNPDGTIKWKAGNGVSGYMTMDGHVAAAVSAPQYQQAPQNQQAPVSYAAPASAGQKTATPPWRRAGSA